MSFQKRRLLGGRPIHVGREERPTTPPADPAPAPASTRRPASRGARLHSRPASRGDGVPRPASRGEPSFGTPLPLCRVRSGSPPIPPSTDGLHRAIECQRQALRATALSPIPAASPGKLFASAPGQGIRGDTRPQLAQRMDEYIERELRLLAARQDDGLTESELGYERLNVFREALRIFVNASKTYSPVLDRILQEYEAFIRHLENVIESAGKDRRRLWKEFEVRQQLREEEMREELAAQKSKLARQGAELEKRRAVVEAGMERIQAELGEHQREVTRMHDQNLTLAHQIVDYRERASELEKELKHNDVWKERFHHMKREYDKAMERALPVPEDGGSPQKRSGGH
eukprot:TRINITY_DN12895_c0_g1_i1.p1 TRINITY_DN12895_c0_g1~~TRINITY_DN12895_c0_g1_i1.p1  ORF type:complete len:362 (+),score=98.29 TRINITY_DN12895_c0_g1_i1:53-1087(+)